VRTVVDQRLASRRACPADLGFGHELHRCLEFGELGELDAVLGPQPPVRTTFLLEDKVAVLTVGRGNEEVANDDGLT